MQYTQSQSFILSNGYLELLSVIRVSIVKPLQNINHLVIVIDRNNQVIENPKMRNSSMRLKERSFRTEDYNIIQEINFDKTVFIAEHNKTEKRILMKTVELGQTNQIRETERINRMINTNHSNLLKPDAYCFKIDQKNKTTTLHLLSPRYPVSLQKILAYHRSKQEYFSRSFLQKFIITMYNLVGKLNDQNMIQSSNLKPSNIFYVNEEWCVSEFGVPSCRISKYYAKGYDYVYAKGRSMQYWYLGDKMNSDQDLYSLGIIIIQIMTLKKVQHVNKILNQYKSQHEAESQQAIARYGVQMVDFAKCLIFGPKSAKMAFKRFKDTTKIQYNSSERFNFSHLQYTSYDTGVPELEVFRSKIRDENYDCSKMFSIFKQYDPELQFFLSQIQQFQKIARDFGQREQGNLLNFWIYYHTLSQMRYISLLKDIYPIAEIVKNIISTAIQNYKDQKQFFIAQTSGKEFWSSEQIIGFFKLCQVEFQLQQIVSVIQDVTKDSKRSYLTYKDIKGMNGKDNLAQSMLFPKRKEKIIQESSKNNSQESDLDEMLSLLSQANDGNLFRFFRQYDPKCKWVNDYVIQRVIKQSIRFSDEKFKKAMQSMWSIAGIIAQNKQDYKLKYVVLLKQTKRYEAVQLFKMILTEMCNSSNFNTVFKEYKVGKNGWNQESLMKLNDDEMLQFHERQVKQVFRDLDTDGSKSISSQELIFKLTGLRQYNESIYVQLLKEAKQSKRYNLIEEFMKNDLNCDLDLDNIPELIKTFKGMDIQINPQHAQKLFYNYEFKDQFMYIKFLKQFYSLFELFKESVQFILKQHYKSDFDRLYKIGLQGKSQKWNLKSLININDQLVLGFTEKQLEEIWQYFDKNGDMSLSKSEVATIFGTKYEQEILSSQYIENYNDDFEPEHIQQKKNMISRKVSRRQSSAEKEKTFVEKMQQEIQKNQILYELRQKSKKRNIIQFFLDADKGCKFALTYSEFQESLKNLGITYKAKSLKQCLKDYEFQNKREKFVNFVKIIMLFNSLKQDQSQAKANTFCTILNKYLEQNSISVSDMLRNPKQKNRWNLDSMEKWIKKSIMSEIYFDDLQMIWGYWGNPKFLESQDLEDILRNNGKFKNQSKRRFQQNNSPKKQYRNREDKYQKEYKRAVQDSYKNQKYQHQKQSITEKRRFNQQVQYKKQSAPKRTSSYPQNQESAKKLLKPPKPPQIRQTKSKKMEESQNISKFLSQLNRFGLGRIQNITKDGYVTTKDFKKCLIMHYGLDEEEFQDQIRKLQRNNRIKLSDLKLMLEMQVPQIEVHSRIEPTSSEYQHSSLSIYHRQQLFDRKTKPHSGLIKENIRLLMSAFSYKKDLSELQKWMFKEGLSINLETFIKKCKDITEAVTSNSLEDIFFSMNPVQQQVSLLSFKLNFYNKKQQQTNSIQFPAQLQKQIAAIFSKGDLNNNKKIEKGEIAGLLSTIGMNLNAKDLDIHFKDMDMDGQNSIDYNEFKLYIQRNIFKSVGDFQQHIDQIYESFKQADFLGTGYLNIDDFKNVILDLKLSISNNEMVSLFRSIGVDNKVQIHKLMNALSNVEKIQDPRSRMALYKIRFGKKISLKDIKGIFSKLSTGYTLSYSHTFLKNRELLPSSALRPKLDSSGRSFKDYYYTNITKIQSNSPCLQRIDKHNQLSLMIRLDEATGVPIPLQNVLNRNNILRRYLSISFFDANQQKLKDSICEFDAIWDPDNQDIWSFNNDLGFEKQILIKMGDYNHEQFDQTLIMFEFIVSYLENGSLIEINCGSSSLPIKQVSRISSSVDKKIQINGGIPTKRRYFKKQDVNARRSVWKKIFSYGQIESVLKIEVFPSSRFKDKLKFIDVLPMRIICPFSCIDLYYCFREYFAQNSVHGQKINPEYCNDNRILMFLHSIDCRNIYNQLIPFWNTAIQYVYVQQRSRYNSLGDYKRWFQVIMDELLPVLMNRDFKFAPSHPCCSSLGDRALNNTRNKLVKEVFQNVLCLTKGQRRKFKIEASSYRQLKPIEQDQARDDNIIKYLKARNR